MTNKISSFPKQFHSLQPDYVFGCGRPPSDFATMNERCLLIRQRPKWVQVFNGENQIIILTAACVCVCPCVLHFASVRSVRDVISSVCCDIGDHRCHCQSVLSLLLPLLLQHEQRTRIPCCNFNALFEWLFLHFYCRRINYLVSFLCLPFYFVISLATFAVCDHRKFIAFAKTKQIRNDSGWHLYPSWIATILDFVHDFVQSYTIRPRRICERMNFRQYPNGS